jgi:large-conductance mechanosensitive channel
MKIITALVSWILMPIAIIVVAYDIAKCFVESKALR